ncbi:MAG: hypothetical protein ACR2MG_07160 [Pyrinomonadaceae bacterium]
MRATLAIRQMRVRAQDTGFQGYQPEGVVVQQPKKSARRGADGD